MRDIKFRAWDGIAEVMWDNVHFDPTHIYLSDWDNEKQNWTAAMPRWETNPIMQFTGLRDKNGKEIYEGDIMRCDSFGLVVARWLEDTGYYPFCAPAEELWGEWEHELSRNCEVVGNICENPELAGETT